MGQPNHVGPNGCREHRRHQGTQWLHEDPMSADEPETATPTGSESPAEETKRKFREALDAKKARQGEDHLDAGQHPGHAHGRVETKRTFRRKTG
jgi:hypothetical protein